MMGEQLFGRLIAAFSDEPPVSIRLNPAKSHVLPAGSSQPVPWCPTGYYLGSRPTFTFDPLFHAGCYYVQEAASMFVGHVISSLPALYSAGPSAPLAVLDLCAAPGGKSTSMQAVLPADSLLVSNEPVPTRAQVLLENVTKWGAANHLVTNNYPRDFRRSGALFDIVLCDVPCSGEGMFRKDAGAIGEWSLQNVEKCWRLQRDIVTDAWECLRPGGFLIYSTCTYNIKENEENVRWICETYDATVTAVPTEPGWGITGSLLKGFDAPVYRFIPGMTRGEGLFMAVLRKNGQADGQATGTRKTVMNKLKVISEGPHDTADTAKERHGKNSAKGTAGTSPYAELSYPDALRYLRGEALTLSPDTPRGLVNVGYKNHPLGLMKNIGNRANNLYPKAWRIKTTHLPAEETKILDIA